MEKGQKIHITGNARYRGQDMPWTETFSGQVTIRKGDVLFHHSRQDLTAFYPKTTCFYFFPQGVGNTYAFVAKKEIRADRYGNEVRIDLEKYRDFEIYYIGVIDIRPARDEYGRRTSVKDNADLLRILPNGMDISKYF